MNPSALKLEKFTGYGTKTSRKISITSASGFGIPPALYKEFGLEKYSYVVLFYDRDAKVIALKLKENDEEGGFKLVRYGQGDKRGASFVGKSFFATYNINSDLYRGRYDVERATVPEVGDVLLIKLKERKPSPPVANNGVTEQSVPTSSTPQT